MAKKYIIEKDDNESIWSIYADANGDATIEGVSLTPYTEPDLEQVRKEAYQKGYETGYEDGYNEPGKNQQEAYQRGLNDAWDAAKKIGNMPYDEEEKAFGLCGWVFIAKHTASEAIEKIRQYEQRQEEQITKGDIVRIKSTPEVEILVTYADEEYVSGIALTEVDGKCEIGDQYTNIRISNVEKTGKHYDIVSVLQKMRES